MCQEILHLVTVCSNLQKDGQQTNHRYHYIWCFLFYLCGPCMEGAPASHKLVEMVYIHDWLTTSLSQINYQYVPHKAVADVSKIGRL